MVFKAHEHNILTAVNWQTPTVSQDARYERKHQGVGEAIDQFLLVNCVSTWYGILNTLQPHICCLQDALELGIPDVLSNTFTLEAAFAHSHRTGHIMRTSLGVTSALAILPNRAHRTSSMTTCHLSACITNADIITIDSARPGA